MADAQVGKVFTFRGVVRDMFLYGGARSVLWIFMHRLWPGYGMLALDLGATLAVFLYEPGTRNWWRMVLAGLLVELIRYGMAHGLHVAVR